MSEENEMIYCAQCGSENSAESKFCSKCGSKLEKAAMPKNEEQSAQTEGIFSGEEATSAYNNYTAENNTDKQGGGNIGFAIASLICGIVSMVCCCFTLFSAILAIAAVVLGIITLCFKYDGRGMAIAGIITGGIGLVIVIFAIIISGSNAYNEFWHDLMDEFY